MNIENGGLKAVPLTQAAHRGPIARSPEGRPGWTMSEWRIDRPVVLTRESVSEGVRCDEHPMKEGLQHTNVKLPFA